MELEQPFILKLLLRERKIKKYGFFKPKGKCKYLISDIPQVRDKKEGFLVKYCTK